MTKKDRLKLIKDIEKERGSRLIVYITGDRRGLETKIATDIFPMFHKHLMEIGHQNKIDLFLYSTGGITIAGYALVNLIREFCDEFNVIVPFKALSCATLITLGANEIVMTPMGQLSPVDPIYSASTRAYISASWFTDSANHTSKCRRCKFIYRFGKE